MYHLVAYEIRYRDDNFSLSETRPVSYVHLWAAAAGISSGFHRQNLSPISTSPTSDQYTYSIRASLSNPTGAGALRICQDILDQSNSYPIPSQITRAKLIVLPTLHELGPIWRNVKVKDSRDIDEEYFEPAEYPWHAWVAGPLTKKHVISLKWDIWMAFDFHFCILNHECSTSNQCIVA